MLIETNKWYSYRSESLRVKDDELESILHKDIRDKLRVDMFSYGQFALTCDEFSFLSNEQQNIFDL